MTPPPKHGSRVRPVAAPSQRDEPYRVLLVEDDTDRVTLTLHALDASDLDVEVQVARDGAEAIAYLSPGGEEPAQPDLILLDLGLPRKDGFEVLDWLRGHQEGPGVPVVVLSSSKEASDIHRAYAAGANSYVQKPVDYKMFRPRLTQILRYWMDLNEACPRATLA